MYKIKIPMAFATITFPTTIFFSTFCLETRQKNQKLIVLMYQTKVNKKKM